MAKPGSKKFEIPNSMQSSNLSFYYGGLEKKISLKYPVLQTVDARIKRENTATKQLCAISFWPDVNLSSCYFFQGVVLMSSAYSETMNHKPYYFLQSQWIQTESYNSW